MLQVSYFACAHLGGTYLLATNMICGTVLTLLPSFAYGVPYPTLTVSLASTYLLTRISVVHHAALNCTRRIFAIVLTSMLFRIPITWMSSLGIAISFASFMVFTYAKTTRNKHGASEKKAVEFPIPNAGVNCGGQTNFLLPTNTAVTKE